MDNFAVSPPFVIASEAKQSSALIELGARLPRFARNDGEDGVVQDCHVAALLAMTTIEFEQ